MVLSFHYTSMMNIGFPTSEAYYYNLNLTMSVLNFPYSRHNSVSVEVKNHDVKVKLHIF